MTGTPIFDVRVQDEGTIVLFWPRTNRGEGWLEENLGEPVRFGTAYCVEHRYAQDIIQGLGRDGLELLFR